MLTKAQKRCGKRGHGFTAIVETGEIVSGCVYCNAYEGRTLGIAALSTGLHPVDLATRGAITLCLLAMAFTLTVCGVWLGSAL